MVSFHGKGLGLGLGGATSRLCATTISSTNQRPPQNLNNTKALPLYYVAILCQLVESDLADVTNVNIQITIMNLFLSRIGFLNPQKLFVSKTNDMGGAGINCKVCFISSWQMAQMLDQFTNPWLSADSETMFGCLVFLCLSDQYVLKYVNICECLACMRVCVCVCVCVLHC